MCWNVAGLSTTVNRIHTSYSLSLPPPSSSSDPSTKRKRGRSNVVIAEYLKRHSADIVCFQEHKIPLSQLSSRSEPRACSDIEGYESFWSCCVDQSKKGLNGVVTFVQKGKVPVVRANSRPLGSDDLDDQGRCIMTDHGNFVLFNVYAPANSGQPLSYKMKFLNALRRAMQEQREKYNKHVILVGDLNISHRPRDKYWADRVLFINDIRREVDGVLNPSDLPVWKTQLALAWPQIERALASRNVVSTQTTNSLTKQKYDKYRMTVQVDGKTIYLGGHEASPAYCEYQYNFQSWEYSCADTNDQILAEEENVVCVSVLAELMMKIARIEWSEEMQREIASTEGSSSRASPSRQWLDTILEKDGMVDAFEQLYPDAEGRYTCWNQFTNRRYENEGARIDFTLVDNALAPYIQKGAVDSLRCGCSLPSDGSMISNVPLHESCSEGAALCAATARGRFQPVSFQGGGIIEASQETLDTQFGPPHTGMIYTPPSFSDHIAVSLLLEDQICKNGVDDNATLEEKDPATRKAQPHKAQKSISSFFVKSSQSYTTKEGSAQPKNVVSKRKKNGIQDFCVPKSTRTTEADFKGKSESSSKIRKTGMQEPKKGSILCHFRPKS